MLLARIYEFWLLTCSFCGAATRIIAFINEPAAVRQILQRLGAPTRSPRFAPARGPPLSEAVTTATAADHAPQWDPAAQALPEIEFDQRLVWCAVPGDSGGVSLCRLRAAARILGAAAINAGHDAPLRRPKGKFSGIRPCTTRD